MARLLPIVLAFAACFVVLLGAFVSRRRRRHKIAAIARLSIPLPRVRLRSQVIVLAADCLEGAERDPDSATLSRGTSPSAPSVFHVSPVSAEPSEQAPSMNEAVSVHLAPTREFAAYAEELAVLSMHSSATRELAVHEAPTRELAAYLDEPLARNAGRPLARAESGRVRAGSGFEPRTRLASERRDEDATLKVGGRETQGPRDTSAEELLRMLGPSPTPDLGNIEIYYRLGLAYLALGKDVQARRCFLTVEGVSPGYRDAAVHLTEIPIYAPTVSGATPVHHLSERVQRRK